MLGVSRYGSLEEMNEHFAIAYCEAYSKLARFIEGVFLRETDDRPKPLNERALSMEYRRFVMAEGIAPIIPELERLKFDPGLINKAKRLCGRLADSGWRTYTAEVLLDSMTEIRRAIGMELQKHKFAHFRPPYDQYFTLNKKNYLVSVFTINSARCGKTLRMLGIVFQRSCGMLRCFN